MVIVFYDMIINDGLKYIFGKSGYDFLWYDYKMNLYIYESIMIKEKVYF